MEALNMKLWAAVTMEEMTAVTSTPSAMFCTVAQLYREQVKTRDSVYMQMKTEVAPGNPALMFSREIYARTKSQNLDAVMIVLHDLWCMIKHIQRTLEIFKRLQSVSILIKVCAVQSARTATQTQKELNSFHCTFSKTVSKTQCHSTLTKTCSQYICTESTLFDLFMVKYDRVSAKKKVNMRIRNEKICSYPHEQGPVEGYSGSVWPVSPAVCLTVV